MTYLLTVFIHGNLVRIDLVDGRVRLQITEASGEVTTEFYKSYPQDGETEPSVLALLSALKVIESQVGLNTLEPVHLGECISIGTLCDVLGGNLTARKALALTGTPA